MHACTGIHKSTSASPDLCEGLGTGLGAGSYVSGMAFVHPPPPPPPPPHFDDKEQDNEMEEQEENEDKMEMDWEEGDEEEAEDEEEPEADHSEDLYQQELQAALVASAKPIDPYEEQLRAALAASAQSNNDNEEDQQVQAALAASMQSFEQEDMLRKMQQREIEKDFGVPSVNGDGTIEIQEVEATQAEEEPVVESLVMQERQETEISAIAAAVEKPLDTKEQELRVLETHEKLDRDELQKLREKRVQIDCTETEQLRELNGRESILKQRLQCYPYLQQLVENNVPHEKRVMRLIDGDAYDHLAYDMTS